MDRKIGIFIVVLKTGKQDGRGPLLLGDLTPKSHRFYLLFSSFPETFFPKNIKTSKHASVKKKILLYY